MGFGKELLPLRQGCSVTREELCLGMDCISFPSLNFFSIADHQVFFCAGAMISRNDHTDAGALVFQQLPHL